MLGLDGEGWGYIGITSATGNAYERHELLAWKFCTFSRNFVSEVEDEDKNNYKPNGKTNTVILYNNLLEIECEKNEFIRIEIYDLIGRLIKEFEIYVEKGRNYLEINPSIINSDICIVKLGGAHYLLIKKL
jgi:hypothetical protein